MESTQTVVAQGGASRAPAQLSTHRAITPWLRCTLIFVLIAYNAVYISRHTPPHVTQWLLWDFSNFYAGSRAWLAGENPYDMSAVYRAWDRSDHGTFLGRPDLQQNGYFAAVYPPSSLVMLAPLAALHAVPAHCTWLAIDLVLFGAMCGALWSMGRIARWEDRLLLVLLLLAWSPGLGVIISGQLSVSATALMVIGVWAVRKRRDTLAGVLFGCAAAVKIQLGLPFIAYYLLLRRWKLGGIAASVLLVTTLIGVLPLEARGIAWLHDWTQNIHDTLQPGEVNDPRPMGPFRDDMINLQTLLTSVTTSERVANALAMTIFVAAGGLFLFVILTYTPRAHSDLLALSLVALLCSLPVYHRVYDAGILSLLGIWAILYLAAPSPRPLQRIAVVALILLAELLIPVETIPFLDRTLRLPQNLTASTFWQAIVIPHHAWAILILAGWGLFMLSAMHLRHAAVARPIHSAEPDEDDEELGEHVT